MKSLKLFLFALLIPLLGTAQSGWEGGVFLGGSNYGGDVVDPDIYDLGNVNLGYGLLIRHHFNPKWALRGNLLFGKIEGNDSDYTEPAWRQRRGFSFESGITEMALKVEWSPLSKSWMDDAGEFQKSWSPYIFAGVGAAFFDPMTNFNTDSEMASNLISRINEDQADDSSVAISTPIGAGIKFDLGPKAVFGIEGSIAPSYTDYLDGISISANPDKNDWYAFGGMTLTFRLGTADEEEIKEPEVQVLDTDGDGIADENDSCPTVAGKAMFAGCPDTDNDGIADNDDNCPDVAGTLNGCPDGDGDGIADKDDRCPTEKGIAAEGGCPKVVVDTDGDGVVDAQDACPNSAGLANLSGCPDTDRDGVADRNDNCPNVAGMSKYAGCPDTDGDGLIDSKDRCPTSAGDASNGGCPTIKAADKAVLDLAIRNIRFETSRSILKQESYDILNQVASVMSRYPNYSLSIGGHTDSVGDSSSNQMLSEKRAKQCFDYLVSRGVSSSRMSYNGYGESQPVADNGTREGRNMNRRVEFSLFLR